MDLISDLRSDDPAGSVNVAEELREIILQDRAGQEDLDTTEMLEEATEYLCWELLHSDPSLLWREAGWLLDALVFSRLGSWCECSGVYRGTWRGHNCTSWTINQEVNNAFRVNSCCFV